MTSTPVVQDKFALNYEADIVDRWWLYPQSVLLSKINTIDSSGDVLECDIPSDIIDLSATVQIVEVCLFTDGSPALYTQHSDILEVTSIEPTVLFKNVYEELTSNHETVKIFVTHLPELTSLIDCQFNNIVLTSLGNGEDYGGNKYIICPIPLFPNFEGSISEGNKSITINLLSWGETIFTSSSTSLHTLKFLNVPEIDTR